MLAAMARGLRLTLAERDHLYRLAGHDVPAREALHDHVSPGLMRVLDRLADTPAQVMNGIGETLVQTPPAVALFGDETLRTGLSRAVVYRWFTDPESRRAYPEEDHPLHARAFVADLRAASARPHTRARAEVVVDGRCSSAAPSSPRSGTATRSGSRTGRRSGCGTRRSA